MNLEYVVPPEDDGKTLKNILKHKLHISNALLIKLKNSKAILVNGNNIYVNETVKVNDKISVNMSTAYSSKNFSDKFDLWDCDIDILYEDTYMLIVNKPAGIPVHPSADNHERTLANAVMNYLVKNCNETKLNGIHIVTRLDKNTSGICIFAKNSYIQELFLRKKESIDFTKEYTAIVNGLIEKDHDIITQNISRKEGTIILREVNENGDFAKTEYTVLSRNIDKNYTVVQVLLHTGRTHQIRVHMSYIGHALLGDELYALEYGVNDIQKYIKRQALHCSRVKFLHPITGKEIVIESNLPDDMKNLI